MNVDLTREEAVALYEQAPCGYTSTAMDGALLRVNETFANWLGRDKNQLLDARNLRELLTASGRLLYDTHYSAVLQLHGSVGDVALELLRAMVLSFLCSSPRSFGWTRRRRCRMSARPCST